MCYDRKRECFRSNYLNVFDFIFGNRGHSRHKIRHAGSYEILFQPPSVVDVDALLDDTPTLRDASNEEEEKKTSSSPAQDGGVRTVAADSLRPERRRKRRFFFGAF
jgi:hypothetical protein